MEYFTTSKYVKLRSHHNKYLTAGNDGVSVKQAKSSDTVQARWAVELLQDKPNTIRLRSCYDKFLTASNDTFLLGWTGKKAVQTVQDDESVEWEPIKEGGLYVKLRACGSGTTGGPSLHNSQFRDIGFGHHKQNLMGTPTRESGKYLRGNFGAPPWSNSVTVDLPERSATLDWIMWVVEDGDNSFVGDDADQCVWPKKKSPGRRIRNFFYESKVDTARCSTSSEADTIEEELTAEEVIESFWRKDQSLSASFASIGRDYKGGMELFKNAKTVRLRSHHNKYLTADDDGESVTQERNGGSSCARWTVEHVKSVQGVGLIRLKSCYDKYLTATDDEFLLGMTGKKVKQTMPAKLDSSIEWEPLRDGMEVKLKTRYGNFLRANGWLPPWRNSITHDVPSSSHTQDWILWEVDVLQVYPSNKVEEVEEVVKEEKGGFRRRDSLDEPFAFQPPIPELDESGSGVTKEGRVIYYYVMDDNGNIIDEEEGERCLIFKGNGLKELTQSIEEDTGLTDITLCTRSPLNGKLYQMRLELPPSHVQLHICVLPFTSKGSYFKRTL